MQIAIVLNPAAGRGAGARLRPRLEKWIEADKLDATIYQTTRGGEATALAAQAANQGASLVVAAGGDGTLGEVLNGIYGTGAKLGICRLGRATTSRAALGLAPMWEMACESLPGERRVRWTWDESR